MITDENLPDGWVASEEFEEYDRRTDRSYQFLAYEREDGNTAVRIIEVQEPKEADGWGYLVTVEHTSKVGDIREEELGVFDDLDGARERAFEYMNGAP